MCKSADDNLVLDSGYLSSSKHLGMNNAPPFTFRQKVQCAPLVTQGFKERFEYSDLPDWYFMRYLYGDYNSNINYTFKIPMNWTTYLSQRPLEYKIQ